MTLDLMLTLDSAYRKELRRRTEEESDIRQHDRDGRTYQERWAQEKKRQSEWNAWYAEKAGN